MRQSWCYGSLVLSHRYVRHVTPEGARASAAVVLMEFSWKKCGPDANESPLLVTSYGHIDLSQHGVRSCLVHYNDVIMSTIASQITSLAILYSTVYSGADQRKHQSSASLAFVQGIHRGPVNSPHKGPVTRKMIPFDDVIMWLTAPAIT